MGGRKSWFWQGYGIEVAICCSALIPVAATSSPGNGRNTQRRTRPTPIIWSSSGILKRNTWSLGYSYYCAAGIWWNLLNLTQSSSQMKERMMRRRKMMNSGLGIYCGSVCFWWTWLHCYSLDCLLLKKETSIKGDGLGSSNLKQDHRLYIRISINELRH